MSEVKIYRGVRNNGSPAIAINTVDDWYTGVDLSSHCGFTVKASSLTDLTELELHPKGEGVWVEGVTAEDMQHMRDNTDFSFSITRGGNDPRTSKVITALQRVWYPQLYPQLPMGETASKEETSSLGEIKSAHTVDCWRSGLGECICPTAKVEKPVTLVINDYSPPLSPRPAKVAIELTEEEARTFIEWMGWDTETHNSITARIQSALDKLSPQPMDEPKEPPFESAVVMPWREVYQRSHVQDGQDFNGWYSAMSTDKKRWSELAKNAPVVIYSPKHIGGEK